MQRLYRKDYTGEFVVTKRTYENNLVTEDRTWVPNSIINSHTGHAVIFGNGQSIRDFDIKPIFTHIGGLRGHKRVETYGCNAMHREFSPDFLIITNRGIADEVIKSGYADNNVVLTHADSISEYPGKFHLIPHDEFKDAGSTAMRVACFDGHKKIYLIGFDGQNLPHENNNAFVGTNCYFAKHELQDDSAWFANSLEVMNTYSDVEFIRVTYRADYPMPEAWKYASNLRSLNYRDFVLEADI